MQHIRLQDMKTAYTSDGASQPVPLARAHSSGDRQTHASHDSDDPQAPLPAALRRSVYPLCGLPQVVELVDDALTRTEHLPARIDHVMQRFAGLINFAVGQFAVCFLYCHTR